MALTINVPPEVEARLREEAAKRGQDAAEYAGALLTQMLGPGHLKSFAETATQEEWQRAFEAWVASHHDLTAPVISLEALRRENLYEDRGV
jgi:plasmid stability protein